jgi:hypothetical protein
MAAARPLAATLLLMLAFGSIHAFSLFLAPLEAATGATRADVSLVYGLALAALTGAVLGAQWLMAKFAPWQLAVAGCILAALGLALAAGAPPLLLAQLGYGLLFGAANGVAYASCLVIADGLGAKGSGWRIGAVTATYALGAAMAAILLGQALPAVGWRDSLLGLAALFALLAGCAGLLLRGIRIDPQTVPRREPGRAQLWPYWLAYGASVAAGLMVLGHAAAIAGPSASDAVATMLAALANAAGGLVAALAADRIAGPRLLALVSLLSLAGLALLLAGGPGAPLAGISLVALAYGAHIAVFPVVIRRAFGAASFAWAYGRVFTAWGIAGIAAPWLAGALFDPSAGYHMAFVAATAVAALGLACNVVLRASARPPTAGVSRD